MLKWDLNSNTFFYFSYGSNMFAFLLHMHCPTAEFVSIARVDNYRLHFFRYSKFWGGPTVTLVPTANAHVWGVLWRLQQEDISTLDEIKGVETEKYYIKYINVLTPHMGVVHCRAYTQKINPLPRGDNDEVTIEQWPSWAYREVMVYGAVEHGLPDYYIQSLKKLKHNGEEGWLRVSCLLNRYAREQPCTCRVPGLIPRKPLKLVPPKIRKKKK